MALSGQVSCGFRHGTVDARQVPLAALKQVQTDHLDRECVKVDARQVPLAAFTEKSPVNQKNLFSRRFFVLEGNIAEY